MADMDDRDKQLISDLSTALKGMNEALENFMRSKNREDASYWYKEFSRQSAEVDRILMEIQRE